jgi:hypothetical protein
MTATVRVTEMAQRCQTLLFTSQDPLSELKNCDPKTDDTVAVGRKRPASIESPRTTSLMLMEVSLFRIVWISTPFFIRRIRMLMTVKYR